MPDPVTAISSENTRLIGRYEYSYKVARQCIMAGRLIKPFSSLFIITFFIMAIGLGITAAPYLFLKVETGARKGTGTAPTTLTKSGEDSTKAQTNESPMPDSSGTSSGGTGSQSVSMSDQLIPPHDTVEPLFTFREKMEVFGSLTIFSLMMLLLTFTLGHMLTAIGYSIANTTDISLNSATLITDEAKSKLRSSF